MTDILVVGGGPAGLAAAIEAAMVGMSVVVMEPRPYPIDKACGEGLMPAAVRSLERLGVEKPVGVPFVGIRIIANERSAEGNFNDGQGLGVRRTELSRVLRDRADAVGVETVNTRIRDVSQGDGWVEAGGVRAHWMIAADGLHSSVRRVIGARLKTKGVPRWGVRAHLAIEPWTDRVEIYYSGEGEAYVTPVSDTSVGVAILTPKPGPFRDLLAAYPQLQTRLMEETSPQIGPEKGAGPFPGWLEEKVHGRILFVGDSAGFLDPITGEGIRLGFEAAHLAVQAISSGQTTRYDHDWQKMSRAYWWLTSGLLAVRRNRLPDKMLVPTLRAVPGLFDQALRLLGGATSVAVSTPGDDHVRRQHAT